ncbi:X-Pro dipeptidyl-peptidase protein [Talaromyces proteolyticus]|uniref:X-Pro dipeptidyl-peptidase protein n=1 Tax=Talaromyces proteolyticus TaxID=1131652 RepID=A0AAD4PVB3_9EURO|nr:X-Pro dipeptidyl-peptidase protein [Talaromyces proteolyticus]KAH8690103.1 X-Pro dipeptidyl-peptidase protein [Talaromyces proteolyticus]
MFGQREGPIQLAGLLYNPSTTSSAKLPALVVVHPGGGVKEQTAGLYAQSLATAHNLITVCYDASHQGESGGEPHFLEDPSQRISDVFAVIDYLQAQPFVNLHKIGILGICAAGGYAVAAAKADHRIKAVTTVSMLNIGDSARLGWDGDEDPKKHTATLALAAQQIRAEVKGAETAAAPYVPPVDEKTPYDMQQAADYYLTPRTHTPRAVNKMLILSLPFVLNFDAFYLADLYLTQPVLLIAGERAGSRWNTEKLDGLIAGAKKKVIVQGATHMDFYDKAESVGPAVKEVAEFMKTNL